VLDFLRRSTTLEWLQRKALVPLGERLALFFARRATAPPARPSTPAITASSLWLGRVVGGLVLAAIGYAVVRAGLLLSELTKAETIEIARGAGATWLRVVAALLISTIWTIPAGVAIGLNPRLARVAQPLAQIAASVPATALFPILLLLLLRVGGGLNLGSVLLMVLGTQWYLLFNVIAGAMAIPTDLKEAAKVYHFGLADRWRMVILPGIFPYLISGFVVAAGGAWNASIVAEYFHFGGQILSTTGLGATISHATAAGNFRMLLAATIVMATMVVTINRLVWRRLYRLAETRFKLET
jgi:NitT/TauT family transport system permease protein